MGCISERLPAVKGIQGALDRFLLFLALVSILLVGSYHVSLRAIGQLRPAFTHTSVSGPRATHLGCRRAFESFGRHTTYRADPGPLVSALIGTLLSQEVPDDLCHLPGCSYVRLLLAFSAFDIVEHRSEVAVVPDGNVRSLYQGPLHQAASCRSGGAVPERICAAPGAWT